MRAALSFLDDPLIAFAVKANPNIAVLTTLAAEGLGADVVSGGEYLRARAAGIAPAKIVFSGVGKTADEMRAALAGGLCQFNLESFPEAELLSQVARAMGRTAPVAFRINPDVDAGSHAKISTGAAHNKFGIPIRETTAACAALRRLPGLELKGLAVHIGSQLTSLAPLETAIARLGEMIAQLRADGHAISTADLGGGLGISYDPSAPPPPSVEDYGAMVARLTRGWDVRLIFEPGRLLVGNAGVLVTEVVRVKPGLQHPFVIVDAAMNDLVRPSLYDAWHEIEAVAPDGERMTADVVGPICESGDVFAVARRLDRVEAGDLMVIRTAGAYAATMAGTYNSRALAPEVLVDGRDWAVVRARRGPEAFLADEKVPRLAEPHWPRMMIEDSARPALGINAHLVGVPGGRWRLNTPSLIVDLDLLEENIARMARLCEEQAIKLRPHAKTHKSIEIARRQLAAGAIGICCAKLGEAEILAAGGIGAILVTSPVVSEEGGRRLASLNRLCPELMIVTDSAANVELLVGAAAASGRPLRVLVDLDVGQHRTGIAPGEGALALAERIAASPDLNLAGIQGYAGHLQHLHGRSERQARTRAAMEMLAGMHAALEARGSPARS